MDRHSGIQRGRSALMAQRRRLDDARDEALGLTAVVTALSGDLVAITTTDDDNPIGGQLLATAGSQDVQVGDTGILVPVRGGSYVFVKTGLALFPAAGSYDPPEPATTARGQSRYAARLDHIHTQPERIPVGYTSSGRHLSLSGMSSLGALVGFTLVANRQYFVPFFLPEDRSVDAISFEVTTAVSGTVRVGFYSTTVGGLLPDVLLKQSVNNTVSTLGFKTILTSSATTLIGGQWFWSSILSTTAMALRGSSTGGNLVNIRGYVTDVTDRCCMVYQDIAAGWSSMTSTASVVQTMNQYIELGARLV